MLMIGQTLRLSRHKMICAAGYMTTSYVTWTSTPGSSLALWRVAYNYLDLLLLLSAQCRKFSRPIFFKLLLPCATSCLSSADGDAPA